MVMVIDDDDASERPTLPAPYPDPRFNLCFETPAEQFFAMGEGPLELGFAVPADDELAEWWTAQRRHFFATWVAGIMALCVAVLLFGALR